jgi:Fatty acid hydroxylase superfamily
VTGLQTKGVTFPSFSAYTGTQHELHLAVLGPRTGAVGRSGRSDTLCARRPLIFGTVTDMSHDGDSGPGDGLTAAEGAVPRRDPARLTLADCWRAFIRRPSPPRLAAALIAAATLRIALGGFSWRDLVVAAGIVGFTPPVEWLIHVFLLHAKPLRVGGREHDLLAAREHRAHHRAPAQLDGVLIPPYAVYIFLAQMVATSYVVSFPIVWVLGGDRLALGTTSLLGAVLVLSLYEWTHYLIHTPYRPRSRYYRSIWHGHRLHHYKNERYWFGVTSTVADLALRTAPDQAKVPKSGTARSLGA